MLKTKMIIGYRGKDTVCTPHPFLLEGGRVDTPTKFSKRGSLTGTPFLDGGCWKRGSDFFQGGGGYSFSTYDKLKSGIFNNKKSL